MKEKKWQILALVLAVGLGVSVFFNVYQNLILSGIFSISSGRTLIFLWPPDDQKIVDGTLKIEVSLDWETVPENLTMVVRVNDDEYVPYDCVGLAFDGYRDFVLLSTNEYYSDEHCNVHERGITWVGIAPWPSPYHTCTYNNRTGYTFKISFPKEAINFYQPMLILLAFQDLDLETLIDHCVGVRFRVTLS